MTDFNTEEELTEEKISELVDDYKGTLDLLKEMKHEKGKNMRS